jgi:GAF domain/Sel1 repeat
MQLPGTRSAKPNPHPFSKNPGRIHVNSQGDVDTLIYLIVERALSSTGASGAALAMLHGRDMLCVATAGSDAPALGSRLQIGTGFSGECVRVRRLLHCDDAESDSRVDRESCRALGIRSMVAAPIGGEGSVVGLLEVFSPTAKAFNASDRALLKRLADSVSVIPNHATLHGGNSVSGTQQRTPLPLAADSGNQAVAIQCRPVSGYNKLILGLACVVLVIAALYTTVGVPRWFAGGAATPTHRQTATPDNDAKPSVPVPHQNDSLNVRRLAEQGDPAAQFAIGAQYATGDDVPQDYSAAVRWFSKAAEQGHVLAQATLGAYYWAGRGVPSDLSKAYFWSILAQAGGDQATEYRVAILNSRIPPSQIVAIKQQASDWLQRHRAGVQKHSSELPHQQ